MAEADIIGAIVAILKADSDVAALIGDNAHGGELPKELIKTTPVQSLLVQPSGGVSVATGTFSESDSQRFDLYCYGRTVIEANALRSRCRRALSLVRRDVVSNCLIHWIEQAGGFATGRDPDSKWPFAFQSFQVFHALQEV